VRVARARLRVGAMSLDTLTVLWLRAIAGDDGESDARAMNVTQTFAPAARDFARHALEADAMAQRVRPRGAARWHDLAAGWAARARAAVTGGDDE